MLARLFPLLLILLLINLFMGLILILGPALAPLLMLMVKAGPLLLLWAVGMAIAGTGNRLAWSAIFFLMMGLVVIAFNVITEHAGGIETGVMGGIVACAAVALIPGFVLWTAHRYGRWRRQPASSYGIA
jgi:hypothetical protein